MTYINNSNKTILQAKAKDGKIHFHYCTPKSKWTEEGWINLKSFDEKLSKELTQYHIKLACIGDLDKKVLFKLISNEKLRELIFEDISVCELCSKKYKDNYNRSDYNCGWCSK